MQLTLEQAHRRITHDERERCCVIADASQPDMPLIYVTRAFVEHTGYEPEEVVGRNCRFLQGPDTDPEDIAAIAKAVAERRSLTIDILNYTKDGTPFWNRLRLRPVFRNGAVDTYVGVQNPIDAGAVVRGPHFDLPLVHKSSAEDFSRRLDS
jgi:PAS domain S-box-containing protein